MLSLPKTLAASLIMACCHAATASIAQAATVGVVAPRTGPYALLAEQVFSGARAAAEAMGHTLVEVDESCEEPGGATAAKALVEAKASFAIGFLCVETLNTAMPILAGGKIPAITISVRSRIIMEDALRDNWPLFRLAPSDAAEAEKVAEVIIGRWKADPIAFVDDGTIYGRELVSAVRQKLEPLGITPVFTDTLRPGQEQQIALVRRLQKAGATHVLLGTDRNDAAIVTRDAAAEGIALVVLGGDSLRAANRPVPLRDGTLAIGAPDYARLPSAGDAVAQIRAKGAEPEGSALPAYAAVQIAGHAADLAQNGRKAIADVLAGENFDTVIGPVRFTGDHELADNPYHLLEWRDGDFVSPPVSTD